ncbi:MAG: response regulator [candidate division NC10 bacterium]|nr:response regulator [candidate division NC10 bacterium]
MHEGSIVIIDDDPLFCDSVGIVLGKAGYQVLSAHDGPSGIELVRAARPAIIILDMLMPGINGITTCQRLKQDPVTREIPVVGITASLELRYAEEAYHAGAEFFLTKPLAPENLLYVVRMVLEREHPSTLARPRLSARFRAHLPVRCILPGDGGGTREVEGTTADIGSTGLLIWLPEMIVPGTMLHLRLALPAGEVTAQGQVIWKDYRSGSQAIPHGVRLVRFAPEGDWLKYKRFLHDLAAKEGV